jgi:hypothetical protein
MNTPGASMHRFYITPALFSLLTACGGEEAEWKNIETLFPQEGAEVTDIAVSFRWLHEMKSNADLTEEVVEQRRFRLQVDDNASFSSPEIDTTVTGPKSTYRDSKAEYSRWTQASYMSPEVLPPGDYHWRVKVTDDSWSKPISFHINDDHSHSERIREISHEAPLFSFDMFFDSGNETLVEKLPELHNRFPASVREHVVFAVQNEMMGMHPGMDDGYDGTFADLLQPLSDAGVPIMIKTGGPDKDFQQFMDLAELEHIFQTQPNVIGLVQGETFWDFLDGDIDPEFYEKNVTWYRRSFLLAAKYGRVVIVGNGNDEYFAWDQFLGQEDGDQPWIQPDELRAISATIIPTAKNNIPFNYYNAESIIMGGWLAGLSDNWGVWSEGWAWGSIGYDSLFGPQLPGDPEDPDFSTMPYNMWLQMKLAGLSQGATVFHFGGESSVVEWGEYDPESGHFVIDDDEVLEQSTAFWDMEGVEHPALEQYVFPFMEAVVEQGMIPTKAEVLETVKIAVAAPPVETDKGTGMDYGVYAPLFIGTIGIDGYQSVAEVEEDDEDIDYYEMTPNACRRELLHNNGRYYMPPILPYPISTLPDDTQVLRMAQLSRPMDVHTTFDAAYPEFSTGSAWVTKVGPRLYINNGHENTNEAQSFSTEIEGWGTLSGTIQPHSYLLVKIEEDTLWLMANGDTKGPYTDGRKTELSLSLDGEPVVEIEQGTATHSWADGSMSIKLKHATGATELNIRKN